MNESIKIAVISDLHCVYNEECNSSDTILFSNQLRCGGKRHPVESLIQFIDKEQLKCDYLLCPGDIANKANIQGLISGFGFLTEISSSLQAKQLFCTPGNHDVCFINRAPFDRADSPIRFLHNAYPVDDPTLRTKFWADNFCIYIDDKVVIIVINSVYNYTDKESAEKTLIAESTLENIEAELSKIPLAEKIKIAITHHHPIKYTNVDYIKYKDADSLENGDNLLTLLDKFNFSILIHGHKHIPRVETRNGFTVFCAGSFSALQNLSLGDHANTFHIVDIEQESSHAFGIIKTWEYRQSCGWSANDSPTKGFPAQTGFGHQTAIDDIAKEIFNAVGEHRYLEYNELLSHCSQIKYLIPSEQDKLSLLLKTEYNLEFQPDLKVGPRSIMKMVTK